MGLRRTALPYNADSCTSTAMSLFAHVRTPSMQGAIGAAGQAFGTGWSSLLPGCSLSDDHA